MSNKQQTAVEWFCEQILLKNPIITQFLPNWNFDQSIIEQAKEVEKEQNLNYLKSYFEWHKSMGFVSHKPEDIIEFNETYGGNK
jgi:hypothetical protein